jgi:hypothetical protein
VNIASDLAQMDSDFSFGTFQTCGGLVTASCFEVVNQSGGASLPACPLAPTGQDGDRQDCFGWAIETALDVETVHTVCRDCKVILVEANSDFSSDLAAAVDEAAALGANIISNSYGAPEGGANGLQQSDFDTFAPHYAHNGVLITASTGDDAFPGGTQFPADINSVISVGGTSLSTTGDSSVDGAVSYVGETAWFTPPSGAGSGCSIFQSPQPWQSSANGWTATGCGTKRAVADVSADASPDSGLAVDVTDPLVCDTAPNCYFSIGGTSLAAPIIAATYALASNPGTVTNLQSLPYAHFRDLHDVISGSTGSCGGTTICRAATGYDGPTGVGTPNGLLGFEIGTPSIGSFSPGGGPAGTTITINGQNFTQVSAVTIGGTPVRSFTVDSDIKITAVAGNGTSGDIAVTGPGGTVTNGSPQFEFPPIISSFTPRGGGTGTSVTITGTGFTGATAVKFDGTAAASFTVDSDTQITATTAAGTNTGPITVTGAGGTGTSSTPFIGPPTISAVNPTDVAVHSTVTVTGTNLTGTSSVKLNGMAVPFSVGSSTGLTFTVPTGATSGPIQVTTPGGTVTSPGNVSLFPLPTITSFTPGTGTIGTPVTITGTSLSGVVGIQIGGVLTVPTSVSPTQVVFSIPPGAVTGVIKLLATNGAVTSATTFTVTS